MASNDYIAANIGKESGAFGSDFTSVTEKNNKGEDLGFGKALQSVNIYNRQDIDWYNRFNRFGCIDPYDAYLGGKEYLFFVKPDLHIYTPYTEILNPQLATNPFFVELQARYPEVILQLQRSVYNKKTKNYSPFITLLSNSVKNTLDLPTISGTETDTGATIYGTSIEYKGSGFGSDEKVDFSLEFEDTKFLELYHFFKAYEEYERLKELGMVSPPNIDGKEEFNGHSYNQYIRTKSLHDQFGVYKFIVDEDYETIVYYAYLCGVMIKNVPREAFSEINPTNGLRYNVDFKAAFIDDMNPRIIYDFNKLVTDSFSNSKATKIPIYDKVNHRMDGTWVKYPLISRRNKADIKPGNWLKPGSMNHDYILQWYN